MRQKRARVEKTADNNAAGKKRIIYCDCNDPGQKLWVSLKGCGIDYSYFEIGKYNAYCSECDSPYWYKI